LTSIQLIQTNYSDLIGITADIMVILDNDGRYPILYWIWILFAPFALGFLFFLASMYACEN